MTLNGTRVTVEEEIVIDEPLMTIAAIFSFNHSTSLRRHRNL